MSSIIANTTTAPELPASAPAARRSASWDNWGRLMVVPYLLVFAVFVLYPVGYGLWLARHPQSY